MSIGAAAEHSVAWKKDLLQRAVSEGATSCAVKHVVTMLTQTIPLSILLRTAKYL